MSCDNDYSNYWVSGDEDNIENDNEGIHSFNIDS